MRVYRLEFLQPDGRWTGPYAAEYMTPAAFELRETMLNDHKVSRPYPISSTFAKNPRKDRYVCGSASMVALKLWFGPYLDLYKAVGGHIGQYEVPQTAIAEQDERQIVYQQRRATLISRKGNPVNPKHFVEKFHASKITTRVRVLT